MIRTLYHGSDHIIEHPEYGKGKPYNDYGPGFYCTDDPAMAKEWAVSQKQHGFANCYTLDCKGLSILDLNAPDYCILHWLSVLLENREFEATSALAFQAKKYILNTFHVEYKDYDCMIGYRADDSYFSLVYEYDEKDKWDDASLLIKSNPSIGTFLKEEKTSSSFFVSVVNHPV